MSPNAMTREERSIYNLERVLINRHFPGLEARPIRILETTDYEGRARDPRLELSWRVANAPARPNELESTLKHLLIHYQMKDGGAACFRGHGPEFRKRAKELGLELDVIFQRCVSMEEWLDDPFLRDGDHAVHPRPADVVFTLTDAYGEELLDFFLEKRWDTGGSRLPRALLPWLCEYAAEVADLLNVVCDSRRLPRLA